MGICPECGAELPEDARFCPSCAAPVAAGREDRERKLATAVFADLVGSTELGGSQDPEHTRALLARFYDAMADEVDTAGGTVEKFAGDAVLAIFGVPVAFEDHAERALHAALAMQHRLRELFGESLALRIGVSSGEVVVGRPRAGSSFATGDSVNVAGRLEQAASPGEILVGERTVAIAGGAFEFDPPQTSSRSATSFAGVQAPPLQANVSMRSSISSPARWPTQACRGTGARGCMPPSRAGSSAPLRDRTSSQRSSPTTTPRRCDPRTSSSRGPVRRARWPGSARRRSGGYAVLRSSQ